jgi:hypothetical protein
MLLHKSLNKNVLTKIVKQLSNPTLRPFQQRSLIFDYFCAIKKMNIRIIAILGEFDSVRNYFEVADFQFLRELSYNADSRLCIVTTSRRLLSDIEAQVKNDTMSNFHQTFDNIHLGMYNDDDLAEY